MKQPLRNYDDGRGCRGLQKGVEWVFSLILVKILKYFKLKASFKNLVNFYNTRRLSKASAPTTTTSATTTCFKSVASKLSEERLRRFEA